MSRLTPRPLGPGSLLWRYAGDHRLAFTGLAAGILQLMHPGVGAGVIDHSDFFTDPWDRIFRSIPEIMGVIYDADGEATGRRVRDFHRTVKGVDHLGREYHALEPETFWWAHATFQFAVEQVVDRFDVRRLRRTEREELYLDGVEWYRRYGVSARPVPPDQAAFRAEWDRVCRDVLELTPAAEEALRIALESKVDELPGLPGWTRPFQREVLTPLFRLTAIGGLPGVVRRRFDLPWSASDELQLKALEAWVRETWRFVPGSMRYGPRAAAGRRRVAAERTTVYRAA